MVGAHSAFEFEVNVIFLVDDAAFCSVPNTDISLFVDVNRRRGDVGVLIVVFDDLG